VATVDGRLTICGYCRGGLIGSGYCSRRTDVRWQL